MTEGNKVLFIVNKFAGGGYRPDTEKRIQWACDTKKIESVIEFTKGPHHAISLAREAGKRNVQFVVAVGGDGTLNEVAQGLAGSGIPMGIIPRGSGNGLARHLCIPLSIESALQTVINGKVISIDTFLLNNKLSLNVSGIGFDGHIANLFGGKTKRGLSGYAKLILQHFLQFKEFDATITLEGETLRRKAFVLAIANSSQYGNNACVAPRASVSDGILHLNILKKVPLYRFDFVYAFFAKTIDRSRYSEIKEATNFFIETDKPIPYHVDGEPCGTESRFEIVIQPSALQVIIPVTFHNH